MGTNRANESPPNSAVPEVPGDRIELVDGVEMYRISTADRLDPFLMTIVSSSDLWMFVSSAGGLTAGRIEPANCLFPYETDDRLHGAGGRTGPVSVLSVRHDGATTRWEPFVGRGSKVRRSVLKSLLGNAVVFEEEHTELELVIRYRWAPSDRFGWVRTVSLENRRPGSAVSVDVVDGLLGVMPWGIDVTLQQQMSNLANAYRRSEITASGLGIFALEAQIVDRPEPAEALRATTVWSTGLPGPALSVDPAAAVRARDGEPFVRSSLRTGRPGSFLVDTTIDLEPGRGRRWHIVADVGRSHGDIARLEQLLGSDQDLAELLEQDIARCSSELRAIVATADGLQCSDSTKDDAHHFANTLFNVMRGGTFADGYAIRADGFRAFVADRNRPVAARHADWLTTLPASIDVQDLRDRAGEPGDPNLVRLANEYLPLAFSRRHGDPSRPWNRFAIRVRDDQGNPRLSYEGNWRDIFQNWEALCRSFPGYLPSVIAKFLNASTAEGFNPYRITSEGIDWEVPEPENPWSGIGYWGDHQIVYLYRLLAVQEAHHPGLLAAQLGSAAHTFADVPYRLVPFEQLLADPKATVNYDLAAERAAATRVSDLGTDGKLLVDGDGHIVHVSLLEKLLIPALAKLSNFVPRGGIWMNTQRPEWNDANNALVGYGLSMVTLAHLRRYLQFLSDLVSDVGEPQSVSGDVVAWVNAVVDILESRASLIDAPLIDDRDRARLLGDLGRAYDTYRSRLYTAGPSEPQPFDPATALRLCRIAIAHLDDAIRAARRPDGLFHSYNLLGLSEDGAAASVEHLPPMLEGQVALIGSGLLDAEAVVALVESMYDSDLYRPDVDSFLLYPARSRPPFVERNLVPAESVDNNPLLVAVLDADADRIIVRDVEGRYRFDADFRNAGDLDAALDELAGTPLGPLVVEHRERTRALFESVFDHHRFTGRSSTIYAYEGIGSVYWHMVAKLLLAIQECILGAGDHEQAARARLIELYDRVRGGLGFNRSAAQYGAFPTDPYSHTPAHAGAQQPGMTGQVKEELLARWAELGLTIADGAIRFTPTMLSEREFRTEPGELDYLDVANRPQRCPVGAGSAAFTLCQVPVIVHGDGGEARIVVTSGSGGGGGRGGGGGGDERAIDGWALDRTTSQQLFDRSGQVTRLDVYGLGRR